MSCSTERSVGLQYGDGGYLFEIRTGMVTRGASLQWLSYYPGENEVCFPPCTALELLRRNRMEEGAIVLEVLVVSRGVSTCSLLLIVFHRPVIRLRRRLSSS